MQMKINVFKYNKSSVYRPENKQTSPCSFKSEIVGFLRDAQHNFLEQHPFIEEAAENLGSRMNDCRQTNDTLEAENYSPFVMHLRAAKVERPSSLLNQLR